jgi:hypothetical protein
MCDPDILHSKGFELQLHVTRMQLFENDEAAYSLSRSKEKRYEN